MSCLASGAMVAIVMQAESDGPVRKRVACVCGYRAAGLDDVELRGLIRRHLDRDHPELPYTDQQIRRWVASGAVFVGHPAIWPGRHVRR